MKDIKRYTDISKIKEECLGDEAFLAVLIESFLEGFGEFLENAGEGLKNRDWGGVYDASHKIKSTITLFNIEELIPVVLNLMERSKNEVDLHTIEPMLDRCQTVYNEVRKELLEELDTLKA